MTGLVRLREKPVRFRARCLPIAGFALLALTTAALPRGDLHAQLSDEYAVKWAFVYNFGKFVEWPSETDGSGSESFRICVLGEDPFRDERRRGTDGRMIKGAAVSVLHLREAQEARGCQILFVSTSERRALPEILDAVRDASILTVSDMENFAESGGMIRLTVEQGKVGFEINSEAAERARLRISSRLLGLARIVRSG